MEQIHKNAMITRKNKHLIHVTLASSMCNSLLEGPALDVVHDEVLSARQWLVVEGGHRLGPALVTRRVKPQPEPSLAAAYDQVVLPCPQDVVVIPSPLIHL